MESVMKKIGLILFLMIFFMSFIHGNGKKEAISVFKKYFTLLSKLQLKEACAFTDSKVFRELKKLSESLKDRNKKAKMLKDMKGIRYSFYRSQISKGKVKLFVITHTAGQIKSLRKYYIRKRKGSWKIYRYRNYPITGYAP